MKSHNLSNRHEAEQKQPDAFYSGSPENREHGQNVGVDCKTVLTVADAMATKRRELINQPLERIWPDLARAAIAAMPGEPVAWQWRCFIAGNWGAWLELDQPVERFKSGTWAFNLADGTAELRPLYAAPAMPATDAMQEAIQYLRDIESHMMANDIGMQMSDHLPPTIFADRLEAALSHPSQEGWQPIETAPKDGTRVWVIQMAGGDYSKTQCGANWISVPFETWRSDPDNANVKRLHSGRSELWQCDFAGLIPTHWQPLPAPPEVQP